MGDKGVFDGPKPVRLLIRLLTLANIKSDFIVIRDSSAANNNILDNFDQIIALYSNEKKINTHIL